MEEKFRACAERISNIAGTSSSFIVAIILVLVWIVSGPLFRFSDTWQLVINTGTTIVTFLMVFLIQNTQNRDALATQLKLDELLHGVQGARTEMINLDMLSDTDLARLRKEFQGLGEESSSGPIMQVAAEVTVKASLDEVNETSSGKAVVP